MSETRRPPKANPTRPEIRRPTGTSAAARDVRATVRPKRPDPRVTAPPPRVAAAGQSTTAPKGSTQAVEEGALRARVRELEELLANEKREREIEAGTMGEMLVRLASAEAKARSAEGSVQNAHDQATEVDTRLRDVEASLSEAVGLLEELEQRERSLSELRARVLREAREALVAASRTSRTKG